MRRSTHGWDVTLYRDEEGEASVDTRYVGFYPTYEEARAALTRKVTARIEADPRWDGFWSATLDEGERVERLTREGVWLFEDFAWNGHRWYIGPDWQEEERP